MSSYAKNAAALAAVLDDPSVLDTVVTWKSNGARGHLHASATCHKVPSKVKLTEHRISINEASLRQCCVVCFEYGFSQLIPSFRDAQKLCAIRKSTEKLVQRFTPGSSILDLHEMISETNTSLLALKTQEATAERDGFAKAHSALRSDLKRVRADLRSEFSLRKEEIVGLVLRDLLEPPSRYKVDARIASAEYDKVLGHSRNSSSRGVIRVYDAWIHGINSKGRDASVWSPEVRSAVEALELSSIEQLDGIAFEGSTADLGNLSLELWRAERDRVVNALLSQWESRLFRLSSRTDSKLLAVNRRRVSSSDTTSMILSAFRVAKGDSPTLIFIRVPEVIASWLTLMNRNDSNQPRSNGVFPLGSGEVDDVICDTAVKLWDLDSSVYDKPEACLQAALALHSS
jgi:hypothetical protein